MWHREEVEQLSKIADMFERSTENKVLLASRYVLFVLFDFIQKVGFAKLLKASSLVSTLAKR